jgi:hypothetical protein
LDGIGYTINEDVGISYTEACVRMPINIDLENLKILAPFDVPETLKEFREYKNITKKELLDWLNENYKK